MSRHGATLLRLAVRWRVRISRVCASRLTLALPRWSHLRSFASSTFCPESLAREGGAQVLPARRRLVNERGKSIKVYCHLCGATLRDPAQYQRLSGPAQRDAVYVCRDEQRCQLRAERDPLTGKPHASGSQPHAPRRARTASRTLVAHQEADDNPNRE